MTSTQNLGQRRLPVPFWLLTGASGLSKLGNTFLTLAVPWILLESNASPLLAALGLAVQYAPYALSPLLGALIDRFDRRRVFVISEVVQGVFVGALPLLISQVGVEAALACLVVVGVGNVVSNLTTDYGLVPSLLAPEDLARGYSRYGAVTQTSRSLGPAVAGLVIAGWGAEVALWIDAVTFLATAAVAYALPRRGATPDSVPLVTMLRSGWREFRRTPSISRLALALGTYNIGVGALPALIILAVQRGWDWSSWVAGLLLAVVAGGAAVGALLADLWLRQREVVNRIGPWFAVCILAGVLVVVPWPPIALIGLALIGVGEGGMGVSTNAYRALVIDPDLAGRVNSLIRAVAMTAVLLSPVVINASVASFDLIALWFLPVLVFAVAAWLIWCWPWSASKTAADMVTTS